MGIENEKKKGGKSHFLDNYFQASLYLCFDGRRNETMVLYTVAAGANVHFCLPPRKQCFIYEIRESSS